MPYGIRVRDSSGNLMVDTTDNLGRALGQVSTGTSDGSITVTDWSAQGVKFALPIPVGFMFSSLVSPKHAISGNTLSWSWEAGIPAGNRLSTIILYGVR
ncbi:hypothetical protein TomMM35A_18710 [Sphingobium sp. TomMM35A]